MRREDERRGEGNRPLEEIGFVGRKEKMRREDGRRIEGNRPRNRFCRKKGEDAKGRGEGNRPMRHAV